MMNLPESYRLVEFDSIDSTNLEAIRLIKDNKITDETLVIWAKSQTAGVGRLGRKWVSEEGNLFASIVFSGQDSSLRGADRRECDAAIQTEGAEDSNQTANSLLPFLAAIAIGNTLKEFLKNSTITYKWPNDVLVDGKKVSGVLIEIINGCVVIVVGLNIASYPDDGVRIPATCINDCAGKTLVVSEVLESLVRNVDKKLQGEQSMVLAEWMSSAHGINKNVTINQGEREISGVFRGIDSNGELILETNGGRRELVLHGDVRFSGFADRV